MDYSKDTSGYYAIDWGLNRRDFKRLINGLIEKAVKEKRVIPIPIYLSKGNSPIDEVVGILSQVDCQDCDAICCRSNPNNQPSCMRETEYQDIIKKYGNAMINKKGLKPVFLPNGLNYLIPMPCPFFNNNKRCSIYPDRPFVCVLYPIQLGAGEVGGNDMLALASECPEGRRIARSIYLCRWQFRKQLLRYGYKE